MVENAVNSMEFSGVNLVTGPSNAGKTLLCEAIRWALTGAPGLRHPGVVGLGFDKVKIVRREEPDGGSKAVVTVDGAAAADPEAALLEMGVIPSIYTLGVSGLFSSNWPDPDPPFVVDLGRYRPEKCASALRDLLAERETLKAVAAGMASKRSVLQTEADALSREIMAMKKQEQEQLDLCALHVMNSGECPVYPVTCSCADPVVGLAKEHFRKRTEGVERIPDFSQILHEKERALASKRVMLEILNAGLPDAEGKNLQARLAEVEARVALGEKVVEGVTKLADWKRTVKEREPFSKISDRLVALAVEIGLPFSFTGRAYRLRGGPVEQASRTDLIMLGYCLQDAAGVPVLIVDDFDVLDKNWKSRLISRATATGKPAILFASSSGPVRISGVASWHLNGRLEKIA